MNIVIKIENLSKQYRLGTVGTGTISHDLNRFWHKVRGKEDPYLKIGEENNDSNKGSSEYIWALKDINFEVKQGEVLGIIGRNGAGKSTLLKILSRTTAPTIGSVKVKGRVASLLEVGTGFHPELSGRENIFLNGAILGMTKQEIKKRFDEIVDFAGVEKYIDTPVKRYSSGMYVRLAFGVAAHLEPEILIVDEVLAVGDAEFQKKALGKMKDVSTNEGRTVLFVSHNMAAIQNLCTRAMMLESGKLLFSGQVNDTITYYLKSAVQREHTALLERKDRIGNGAILFTGFELKNSLNEGVNFFQTGGDFMMNILFNNNVEVIKELKIALGINNYLGDRILHLSNEMTNHVFRNITGKQGIIKITLPKLPLKHGRYAITLFSTVDGNIADWIQDAFYIDVEHGDFYKNGISLSNDQGYFLLEHEFYLTTF
ncbi:MAG: ABC transporter ATP-binding protein [Ginsengibacter sp.]